MSEGFLGLGLGGLSDFLSGEEAYNIRALGNLQ